MTRKTASRTQVITVRKNLDQLEKLYNNVNKGHCDFEVATATHVLPEGRVKVADIIQKLDEKYNSVTKAINEEAKRALFTSWGCYFSLCWSFKPLDIFDRHTD